MSYHSTEPILTEGFITDFLLKLSNEVYDLRVRRGISIRSASNGTTP